MSNPPQFQDWLNRFTDPYAVLGVSLAADERRILKRYRQVAKLLHPDVQSDQDEQAREFASQVLARLVNPAYQRLKNDKGRNETLATLRFKVRRLSRENALHATFDLTKKLLEVPDTEIEVFYEQTLLDLSTRQYDTPDSFDALTRQVSELNLAYLRRKMGDPVIREKRSGLVTSPGLSRQFPVTATAATAGATSQEAGPNYAEKHSQRAQEYLRNRSYPAAIQELKDAIKIEPQNSTYHCLLGQAYLLNQLPGMAKVHFKQSLKLNPKNEVALKYARQLQIEVAAPSGNGKVGPAPQPQDQTQEKRRGLFGGLFSRR